MAPWLIAMIVATALQVVAYIITPKPKAPRPAAVEDAQNPTASKGRPIPVIFGTVTISGVNVLWFGDKSVETADIKV